MAFTQQKQGAALLLAPSSLHKAAEWCYPPLLAAGATLLFRLLRSILNGEDASLLYLPVVIVCAHLRGFRAAAACSILCLMCWDFFFLPPYYTFRLYHWHDAVTLLIFMLVALLTAWTTAQAHKNTQLALAREAELTTLAAASEALSQEVTAKDLLAQLAKQLQNLCGASHCIVFESRGSPAALSLELALGAAAPLPDCSLQLAKTALQHGTPIGFGESSTLWNNALHMLQQGSLQSEQKTGVYVPLYADKRAAGVLHVGARPDGLPFSSQHERVILTLANYAAVALARDVLAQEAAEAEALREADAFKNSLLSLVSHELRSPLAAIRVSAESLLLHGKKWKPEEQQNSLRSINREAVRLSRLVNNLLDLSRLESGAWKPVCDWCDLAEIAASALDRLSEEEAERVVFHTEGELPFVQADYLQIVLVLSNLLENALKYSPPASPVYLILKAEHKEGEKEYAGVSAQVRDCGPGISPGEEKPIFEKFYRGKNQKQGPVHGTGLGLALCMAIVQAHHGRIKAENMPPEQQRGALFTLFLPREQPH